MDLSAVFREFITLFVVIDPIGSVPVFLFATKYVPRALHRRFAIRAILVATAVLIGFLFFGQKIGLRRSLALLVGFIGVVVLATSKAGGLSVGGAVVAGTDELAERAVPSVILDEVGSEECVNTYNDIKHFDRGEFPDAPVSHLISIITRMIVRLLALHIIDGSGTLLKDHREDGAMWKIQQWSDLYHLTFNERGKAVFSTAEEAETGS